MHSKSKIPGLNSWTGRMTWQVCSMSNKALSVGSRGTVQHLASPHAVWGLLTSPSVLYYLYSTLVHALNASFPPVEPAQ